MKTLILSLAICCALATPVQAAQYPSSPNRVQEMVSALPPGISYSTTAFPWETRPSMRTGQLNRLLADLRDDMETMAPTLAALNETIENAGAQSSAMDSGIVQYAPGNTLLPAKDLSTLVSQNLSANLGQNLATSLAVPTSVPWSAWGNGGGMPLVNFGGAVVPIPTFPPRTAWGNGPGTVVTTPGGAVYTLVPGTVPVANTDASREALRQLAVVQDDLDRTLLYLATASMTNGVAPTTAPSPGQPPVYLNPTGR